MYADIELTGGKKSVTIKHLLVDTGASYTVLPEEILIEAGAYKFPKKKRFTTANGSKITATLYAALISIEGAEAPCICITFKGATPLIGIETLEAIGLKLDPVKRRLEFTRPKGTLYLLPLVQDQVGAGSLSD